MSDPAELNLQEHGTLMKFLSVLVASGDLIGCIYLIFVINFVSSPSIKIGSKIVKNYILRGGFQPLWMFF